MSYVKRRNYIGLTFRLSNGVRMPAVSLALNEITDHGVLLNIINEALGVGYRLFDTTPCNNDAQLASIFSSLLPKFGLTRNDILITLKLTPFTRGKKFEPSDFEMYLDRLNLEYVDILLLHFPVSPFVEKHHKKHAKFRQQSWVALSTLYKEAKVKAIGVSNFTVEQLEELAGLEAAEPMIIQMEWHPYYYQTEMLQYCAAHGIRIQSNNPFGGFKRGNLELVKDNIVRSVATKYGVTSSQVLLLWALQKGVAVIPDHSASTECVKRNSTLDLRLTANDIARFDGLGIRNKRYSWDPIWSV